ncbi:T9SS type A sorting domain-containing protein [candidate division KSB1 bacterium]|nr:T9SS type A sorting domain-containing protein [candidate division KSB1 bacterium]
MRTLWNSKSFLGAVCVLYFVIFLLPASAQITLIDTTDQFGEEVRIERNQLTGTAHRIWYSNPNIEIFGTSHAQLNQQNVAELARAILTSYQNLLKVGPSHLVINTAETDGENWYISFEQRYKNLPVYGASAGVTINAEGKIISIGADAYPDVQVSTVPNISERQAEETARTDFTTAEMDTVFLRTPVHLVIYPDISDNTVTHHLAFVVELESKPLNGLKYFIDAHSGTIVAKQGIFVSGTWNINGNVSGQYWPEVQNVNTTTEAPNYLSSLTIFNVSGQTVATGNINSNGDYSITFNAAYGTYFLDSQLKGSWIKVKNVNHSFGFTSSSNTVHNFQFSADNDGYNVYHHGNVIHDFFKGSPFNYNGMDYQMEADINAGSSVNAAANGIDIFFGSRNGILWLGASDVTYHEYTHNTIYHLYGNRFIGDPNDCPNTAQGCAMDEGLSDYFAATINGNSCINLANRDLAPNQQFPNNFNQNDATGHNNGLIIGGAAWDLQGLVGTTTGRKLTFKALQMTPHAFNFTDFVNNIIVADDNNGQLCDGTPNYNQIITAFQTNHGIVPTLTVGQPLSVNITGPGSLGYKEQGTYTANVTGCSPFSYEWRYRYNGTGPWSSVVGTSQQYSRTMLDTDFELQVKVTSGGQNVYDTHYVSYEGLAKSGTEITAQIPEHFSLEQNYPNPFNPTTEIKFALPEHGHVILSIFNVAGQKIQTVVDEQKTAGYHNIIWDSKDQFGNEVASGIYVYRIHVRPSKAGSEPFESVKKMTLLR